MDGMELALALRGTKGFKSVPIVLLASKERASQLSGADLLATRAQALLHTPVTPAAFRTELRKLFGKL